MEPVNNDELEKTNFDINYTLSDQNDNKELENTINNAFAFDGEDTFNQNLGTNNNDLGETVIIEPVDLKPVEKVEEVKENTNVESNAGLQVVEEKKVVENNATEIQTEVKKEDKVKTKKDGRFFVLILLIVMLLLSFVILLPTIIEKFAI